MFKSAMDKRVNSIVSYKCLMFMFFIVRFSAGDSCHRGLPNHLRSGNSTWKLCVINTNKDTLRFKIKGLFSKQDGKPNQWLNIGFPDAGLKAQDNLPFFLLEVDTASKTKVVLQTEEVKNKVNCSMPEKGTLKFISVDCVFKESANKYVKSKKIKIFWNSGFGKKKSVGVKEGENLIKNHSVLYFYPHQDKDVPDENAGSTAMRLLRNYGKSMGAIFGISIFLTALITLTICCCCKKKTPPVDFNKQKMSKDSSVSYYRDDSEGDGQSDETDDDEKVAFIRNNNERNSSV